jgi:hypothetical protein
MATEMEMATVMPTPEMGTATATVMATVTAMVMATGIPTFPPCDA